MADSGDFPEKLFLTYRNGENDTIIPEKPGFTKAAEKFFVRARYLRQSREFTTWNYAGMEIHQQNRIPFQINFIGLRKSRPNRGNYMPDTS
jgi:hypothetical protein